MPKTNHTLPTSKDYMNIDFGSGQFRDLFWVIRDKDDQVAPQIERQELTAKLTECSGTSHSFNLPTYKRGRRQRWETGLAQNYCDSLINQSQQRVTNYFQPISALIDNRRWTPIHSLPTTTLLYFHLLIDRETPVLLGSVQIMRQKTHSNAKLSCSTLAAAHSWPKQTYNSTQKQWQSIILVRHTNKLPVRGVSGAFDFSIWPGGLWECSNSNATEDLFQR